MTGTSVAKLFIAGIVPGLVLALSFAILVAIEARRNGIEGGERTSWRERLRAVSRATWALGMPLIILGGIYTGYFTPTEAAAVSVVYAIFVETVIFRSLNLRKLIDITERAALSTAIIFILLALGGLLAVGCYADVVAAQSWRDADGNSGLKAVSLLLFLDF